jgi:hypothetical protein
MTIFEFMSRNSGIIELLDMPDTPASPEVYADHIKDGFLRRTTTNLPDKCVAKFFDDAAQVSEFQDDALEDLVPIEELMSRRIDDDLVCSASQFCMCEPLPSTWRSMPPEGVAVLMSWVGYPWGPRGITENPGNLVYYTARRITNIALEMQRVRDTATRTLQVEDAFHALKEAACVLNGEGHELTWDTWAELCAHLIKVADRLETWSYYQKHDDKDTPITNIRTEG